MLSLPPPFSVLFMHRATDAEHIVMLFSLFPLHFQCLYSLSSLSIFSAGIHSLPSPFSVLVFALFLHHFLCWYSLSSLSIFCAGIEEGYLEKIGVQVQSILWCYSVSSLPASCSAPLMTENKIRVRMHSALRYTYTVR